MDQIDAINPDTGRLMRVEVPKRVQDRMLHQGRGRVLEFVKVVVPSLLTPAAVFRGIRDSDWGDGDDDGLCYSSRPTAAYDYRRGVEVNPWAGQLLLVFVNGDLQLYNWRWEFYDPDDETKPIDWETRFRELAL